MDTSQPQTQNGLYKNTGRASFPAYADCPWLRVSCVPVRKALAPHSDALQMATSPYIPPVYPPRTSLASILTASDCETRLTSHPYLPLPLLRQ